MQAVAQQGNAQGITLLAASGDFGSAMCDMTSPTPQASKGVTVSSPASMPEVTAVGGTQFNEAGGTYWSSTQTLTLSSALSYIPEMVWDEYAAFGDLNSATGGGPSAVFSKPWWQSAPGVPDDHVRDHHFGAVRTNPDGGDQGKKFRVAPDIGDQIEHLLGRVGKLADFLVARHP